MNHSTTSLAAALLTLVSTSVLAIDAPNYGGTAGPNGSLIVTVFDPVVGVSVVQQLDHPSMGSIHYQQFLMPAVTPDSGLTLSFDIDMSILAQYGSQLSDIRYTVFAGDGAGSPVFPGQTGVLVTANSSLGTFSGPNFRISAMNNAALSLTAVCNSAGQTSVCNGTYFDGTYVGGPSWGYRFGEALPVDGSAQLGTALGFYSVGVAAPGPGAPFNAVQFANAAGVATWLLGSDGVLTYSVPAVPLPGAVWLLLSGLGAMGLAGRKRRDNSRA